MEAIFKQFGVDILLGKLNAYIADFAPSLSTANKRLVNSVYEFGASKALKENLNGSQEDKERAVKIAIRNMTESFVKDEMAEDIIYEFADALGWKIEKITHSPKSDTKPAVTQTQSPPQSASKIKADEIIPFGNYNWLVLDVQNNKALILTENIIEKRPYNKELKGVTWETCTLRKYLNGEFLREFSSDQQRRIEETRIENNDNQQYGTKGGSDTIDKIFLLSFNEVNRYFGNDSDRIAKYNKKACWWWLRSPGYNKRDAACVDDVGSVSVINGTVYFNGGVRPALWLNL